MRGTGEERTIIVAEVGIDKENLGTVPIFPPKSQHRDGNIFVRCENQDTGVQQAERSDLPVARRTS